MRDCDDDILEWFGIFLIGKNRRFQLEQSSDITFYANSVKRKLIIKLSSPLASVTPCGSHVSMDNLLGIDFGFWPLKPILATGTPINNFALRKNVKKRDLKPFSGLKKYLLNQQILAKRVISTEEIRADDEAHNNIISERLLPSYFNPASNKKYDHEENKEIMTMVLSPILHPSRTMDEYPQNIDGFG